VPLSQASTSDRTWNNAAMDPPVDLPTLRELYTTPPAEFVASRNQLVKERKAAKDKEGAAALGKLRKAPLADWALNVVATDHADDVNAFLDAASAVRDAQAAAIEGRDGPDIRAALRDLRDHSGRVLSRAQDVLAGAGRDAGAEAGTVATRLTEIAANDEASKQLGAGVLGSAGVGVVELFGDLQPARPSPRSRARKSVSPKPRSTAPSVTQTRERERALREARRERDQAAKDVTRATTAADKAAAAVRNAERALERAREALDAAESGRADAERRLTDAEEAVSAAEGATR
jgi:hypothetical protein